MQKKQYLCSENAKMRKCENDQINEKMVNDKMVNGVMFKITPPPYGKMLYFFFCCLHTRSVLQRVRAAIVPMIG